MEALHKLAGVRDTSDLNVPPAEPLATDTTDADATLHDTAPRASVPLNRRPSHKSFRSGTSNKSRSRSHGNTAAVNLADYPPPPQLGAEQQQQQRASNETGRTGASASSDNDDFAWGPSHPCFPHPNPHCAPDSEEHRTTRVIRVKRDFLAAGDLYPQFANLYPEILDPLVTDTEFRFFISNLNTRLKAAFNPFAPRAWLDAVAGALTGYIWEDVGATGAKSEVKGLEKWIDAWNEERRARGQEGWVVTPRTTGFMTLDWVVPDPGVDVMRVEGEEEMVAGAEQGANDG